MVVGWKRRLVSTEISKRKYLSPTAKYRWAIGMLSMNDTAMNNMGRRSNVIDKMQDGIGR